MNPFSQGKKLQLIQLDGMNKIYVSEISEGAGVTLDQAVNCILTQVRKATGVKGDFLRNYYKRQLQKT